MAASTTLYRFKDITVIPSAKDLIDIVLSRTQRKTPTEVHKQFRIGRIRTFYIRKVKFCQQTIHDKLTEIITQFPKLDDIHPFYSDLCNVLYDRDHYKLALGQCNAVRGVVDNLSKSYVKLMKYGDSLYKLKTLKRAALGRMCTAMKKLTASFAYLEEVRQHLARLPSINPHTRTLILSGYPNVGKSSFLNNVTNANVEVEPYAFTTKSLYVGHFDYGYTRWQVIDTPGILDRPLEDRNTIEMTAITALAHIQAAVIYIVDISEQCGFSLEEQMNLFLSIKPLFKNKPLIILLNKIDAKPLHLLEEWQRDLFNKMRSNDEDGDEIVMVPASTLTTEGVDEAKTKACDLLLDKRVRKKTEGKRIDSILNRLYITKTTAPVERPPCIPQGVIDIRKIILEGDTVDKISKQKELEEKLGGAGVYSMDWKKKYMLENEEWRYDMVPEILDGRNVLDFIDPDIDAKLIDLEKEENLLAADHEANYDYDGEKEWQEMKKMVDSLHAKVALARLRKRLRVPRNSTVIPRSKAPSMSVGDVSTHLASVGYDVEEVAKRGRARRRSVLTRDDDADEDLILSGKRRLPSSFSLSKIAKRSKNLRTFSAPPRDRSRSLTPSRLIQGLPREIDRKKAVVDMRRKLKKRGKEGRQGEGDRFIGNKMPKHLFAGKRGIGKTSRR